ncbi:histidine kinase osmosensor [Linnemannia schmuckeri]|uniref:Histidine kinase osmosensor n=1 Tax=Linnemannia schmuckeri TaxID=64567 RepID=A0A9P5VFU8_9FUNG|nr:histidine kinase osmosensor [Linnemannia schmuckeri]
MSTSTGFTHSHSRSLSQPAIPLSQEHSLPFLPHQQQLFDLMAEQDSSSSVDNSSSNQHRSSHQQQQHQSQQQQQQYPQHSLDMSRFLDFAVEASVLLETLHQNGLIHGQLCPTSFRWEESSSLKKAIEPASNTTLMTTTSAHTNTASTSGVLPPPATSSANNTTTTTSKADQDHAPLTITSTLTGASPSAAVASTNAPSSTCPRTSYQSHPSRKDNHTSPASLSRTHAASNISSTNNINNSSSINVTGNSSSTGGSNSSHKPGRRQRRYSLVLDCTHLGLGEKSSEPPDSPARKGLRDQSHNSNSNNQLQHPFASPPQSASSSPSAAALTNGSFENNYINHTSSNNASPNSNAGSFLDPLLFSPSDANLLPYSNTNSAAVFHDAIAARMARIKRTLLPSSSSSPTLGQSSSYSSSTSSSTVASQSGLTSTGTSGAPLPFVLKRHFMLHVPQELHSPPGCVLPVQIDIYTLGVMFYYQLTSYTILLPEDMLAGSIEHSLAASSVYYGHDQQQKSGARGAVLASTPSRLANVIQRMVAKSSKDRFLSMIQVRKELSLIRDQELEASNKEAESKVMTRTHSDNVNVNAGITKSSQTHLAPSSYPSNGLARPASPANSTHSFKSTDTRASQEIDTSAIGARVSAPANASSSSHSHGTNGGGLTHEDRAFVLESVLNIGFNSDLRVMLRAISHALDNILVGHPPEEMAIILWQKDEHLPNGGTWAILEDKFQPGTTNQSNLTWTDLSERRDHMPVLVRKALDTQEPIFSTAVGSRSQLPTIACVPIVAGPQQHQQSQQHWATPGTSSPAPSISSSTSSSSTLVGAIYLHHLHPRFYFTKRDQDMLILFCQKLAPSLQHCDKLSSLEKQLALATHRSRVLEETNARIRKNEDEVFSWMEALPCFVWAAEPDDIASRRYLSRSWFEFTGFPGDKRTSDRWISAMHPDDVAAFQKEVSQSYKTGVYKDCEFRLMRFDGVYRWHLSRAIPVLNQYGAILKWVGVTIDIDDLYLAQKAELHKKSNFLANMSHELRTPFSGFHGMLTLLGYSNLDEEQQECVFTAKASCEKLLLIIDDLLDFSKLEADKVTLEASPFDLQEVFDEVEDIVESLASQKSLELAFLKADNVPDVLTGDCNRLKQILLNLVGNAIKFTHTGHVVVKCRVLDRDTDMTALSPGSSSSIDDDKFYFRHEKNGGGQCQSEMRPPNSGRFSSPEPLSESSVKLMFSVEDTGIGISLEEQEVLFSPFSQVDGSATRSYGGSGLGLSICLQLVKLMKGRIGLVSERDKGSTFWFVIQCELGTAAESPVRAIPETDVVDSTKEIKRITRTLGTPRILIASTSETTISTLQSYLSDFNTEVANLPSTAASRLEESVVNGIRFDFVCWDFPKYDPQHAKMLELKARPDLNNVHFVLLYTPLPSPDLIRRAQSLQLPPTSSSGSPSLGNRKRPTLSQSVSLRLDNSGSVIGNANNNHNSGSTTESEVPGLSPEKLNSLRITCISKPIRRLKLLRAFVEILDDSTRIHGSHAVKKVVVANVAGSTPIPPTSPTTSSATAINSPISSPTNSIGSSATLSPAVIARSPSTSMIATLNGSMTKESSSIKDTVSTTGAIAVPTRPSFPNADSAAQFLSKSQEQNVISQTVAEAGLHSALDTSVNLSESDSNNTGHKHGSSSVNTLAVVEEVTALEESAFEHQQQRLRSQSLSAPSSVASSKTVSSASGNGGDVNGNDSFSSSHHDEKISDDHENDKGEKEEEQDRISSPPPVKVLSVKQKLPVNSSRASKLRSNSPKPTKTSKLVTEEATENSLSLEEANRITGMRILLAEDNKVAQMVLSKQLALFGLVISCANDGADALALFNSHPRGYYTMGFFDHHMPNCDGVQATQQIRLLEREHAAEVKGPVPRLPIVAVSADIQETARKACLNSGMERYVTKPLMQKDLVAMVRQYCVIGDAEASTHSYVSPPEGAGVSNGLEVVSSSSDSNAVTSTVEAMVSAGHVSAPIGSSSGLTGPMLLSPSPIGPQQLHLGSPLQKQPTPAPKRDLELSPAAMRGLALIRENTLQDESSKVGGGGNIKAMNLVFPTSMAASASTGSLPTQQQLLQQQQQAGSGVNHLGLRSHGSQSQLRTPSVTSSLSKSISSSSLSGSYHAGAASGLGASGGIVSSPIIMSTSTPVVTSSPSPAPGPLAMSGGAANILNLSSFGSHHHHHPIAAMAAGAAAAAAAVVSTVSSAISEHIHPPSIYAAQPNSSALSSPWKGSLEGQQIQQDQLQQPFVWPSFTSATSTEQAAGAGAGAGTGEHIYHPPQEVFVPYLHPCEPSPTMDRDEDPMTSGSFSAAALSLGPTPASTHASALANDTGSSSSNSNGAAAESASDVTGVQAALTATAAASALTGATAKAVAATNATMTTTATVQMNNWL